MPAKTAMSLDSRSLSTDNTEGDTSYMQPHDTKNKTNIKQSPSDDHQKQYTTPNKGGVTKPTGTSYNFGKIWNGTPDGRFEIFPHQGW